MIRPVLAKTVHILHGAVLGSVIVFMFAPTLIITIMSFSNEPFISFPPSTWGFRQYETFFASSEWLGLLMRSFAVAAIASLVATAIGVLAVIGIHRTNAPGRSLVQALGIGPLLVPGVAYAIALYALFSAMHILGTPLALVLAHIALTLPFVLLIVSAAITRIPSELESAAVGLGASRQRAWWDITLQLLRPSLLAALVFAFIYSLDEAVIASFLGYKTLPVAIFNSVRFGVDPVITAISTILMLVVGALSLLYEWARRSERRR